MHPLVVGWLWLRANAAPVGAISSIVSIGAVVAIGSLSWKASNRSLDELKSQRRLAVAPYVQFIFRQPDNASTWRLLAVMKSADGKSYRPTPQTYIFGVSNLGTGPALRLRVLAINGHPPLQAPPLSIHPHESLTVCILNHSVATKPITVEAEYYDLLGEQHLVPRVTIEYQVNGAKVTPASAD